MAGQWKWAGAPAAALLAGCIAAAQARVDGRYVTPAEVSPFHNEVLVLRRGQFEHHLVDDVPQSSAECGSNSGQYTVDGDTVTLHQAHIDSPVRRFAVLNGHPALLTNAAHASWQEGWFWTYGILVRVPDETPASAAPPSVEILRDAAMVERERRAYEGRFMQADEPLRSLMRALTDRDDADGARYFAVLATARSHLTARMLQALVFLSGSSEGQWSDRGCQLLEGLLLPDGVTHVDPFAGIEAARRDALGLFVEALEGCESELALRESGGVLLKALGLSEAKVPGAGGSSTVDLEVSNLRHDWREWRQPEPRDPFLLAHRWQEDSRGIPPADDAGRARLAADVRAVQSWAREQLSRRFPR